MDGTAARRRTAAADVGDPGEHSYLVYDHIIILKNHCKLNVYFVLNTFCTPVLNIYCNINNETILLHRAELHRRQRATTTVSNRHVTQQPSHIDRTRTATTAEMGLQSIDVAAAATNAASDTAPRNASAAPPRNDVGRVRANAAVAVDRATRRDDASVRRRGVAAGRANVLPPLLLLVVEGRNEGGPGRLLAVVATIADAAERRPEGTY